MSNSKIIIFTPIFSGSGTGAAVYYKILADSLYKKGIKPVIISENTTEIIDINKYDYFDILPTRTGKNKHMARDVVIYGWQNLAYLKLPRLLKKIQGNIVFIHSSFYNFPGIFPQVMQFIMAQKKLKQNYIADVRDVLIPAKQVSYLAKYDKVIACSDNVFNNLIKYGIPSKKLHNIPIPQEKISVYESEVKSLLVNLGLQTRPYIFYSGMIKELKAVDLLLESFTKFVSPIFPDVVFVLAGYIKTAHPKILQLLHSKKVRYIGNRSRQEVLQLMAGAQLCINLSPNEGMPRSSLEALALKCSVLLPPNVPEFMHFCPNFVVTSRDPEKIADKIMEMLRSERIPSYPIERHFPENIIIEYEKIINHFND